MEQRHVEIPPKRLYNDHTDKMDEMSILTLCKLAINHKGWTKGMLKYPKMPLELLYGQKTSFGQKHRFLLTVTWFSSFLIEQYTFKSCRKDQESATKNDGKLLQVSSHRVSGCFARP